MNSFGYVGGNPIGFSDPTGQCPWCIAAAVGGAVALYELIDLSLSLYDVYELANTLLNDCISGKDKLIAAGMTIAGFILPGNAKAWEKLGDVASTGSALDLLKNAEITKSGLKVDNATLQQIGAAEAGGGKGFSGLTPNVVQSKPATWLGEKTGGTQTVIKYQDASGQTKFTVHTVTDGAGKVVHRDFDSVLIQSGQQVVK